MSIYSPITINSLTPLPKLPPSEMLTSRTSLAAAQLFSFKPLKPLLSSNPPPPLKMSLSTSTTTSNTTPFSATQFVEHIVLFKIKPETPPSKVTSMLTNLNNLISLDTVLHLSAGPILRHRSPSLTFTHLLHSRYLTKSDYAAYSDHPSHVSVVADYVKPIVADIMAVDWVAEDASGAVVPTPGSALRVMFVKLKEEGEGKGKERVLEVMEGMKGKVRGVEQLTVGENFSVARGKGFSVGSVAVFRGVGELDALEEEGDVVNAEKDKVRDLLEEVLVVDYVVPPSQSASL